MIFGEYSAFGTTLKAVLKGIEYCSFEYNEHKFVVVWFII